MIEIDWFEFLRHRCILGFHIKKSRTRDPDNPFEFKLVWDWDWKGHIKGKPAPWHRTWKW
jgi:hypothetical protein